MSRIWERAIEITQQLIRFPSVSSTSNEAVSQFVADVLASQGFAIEWLSYRDEHGIEKVSVVGKRGTGVGGVGYLAHTDVVPANDWSLDFCGPFDPVVRDDRIYGRGACDMKGSIAAALVAISSMDPDRQVPTYFVITSDEEVGMHGARFVNTHSQFFEEMVQHQTIGIVGEPTSLRVVHAHKGGLRFEILARGKSAHTSTTDGVNANYALFPALPSLLELRDRSESQSQFHSQEFDPPTLSWNMTIVNEPQAVNVTPSMAKLNNFLRTMPGVNHEPILDQVMQVCDSYGLEFDRTDWVDPWSVDPGSSWIRMMLEIVQSEMSQSVCYATDAGVLQRLKPMLICGPGDIQQAHRSDEWIALAQLEQGVSIYREAFMRLLLCSR